MAVFQCPHCRSTLSAGNLGPGTTMKCPKCSGMFVYQEAAPAGGASASRGSSGGASSAFTGGSSTHWLRETFGHRGIQMLIGLVVAMVAAVVMVVVAVNHSSQEQPPADAIAAKDAAPAGPTEPGAAQKAAPQEPPPIPTDPGLEVQFSVGTDAGGNAYAFGTVLNKFEVPLGTVHLKVYVKRAAGPTGECLFVPPKSAVRFSIPLGVATDVLTMANIFVSAFAEASPEGTVMWNIPDTAILRGAGGDTRVWTGETANPTNKPVRDVRIYCDFYSRDGLQGCSASVRLEGENIQPRQRMPFSLRCEDVRAESAEIVVVRAVARTR